METSSGLFRIYGSYFKFSLGYRSHTATHLDIDNEPPTLAIAVNIMTVLTLLDCVNSYLVHDVFKVQDDGLYAFGVSSLYRSYELNEAIGGAPRSAHMVGKAVDLVLAPSVTVEDFTAACDKFQMKIKYIKQYKTHIHVTFDF